MIWFLEDNRGMSQSSVSQNSLYQHMLISLPLYAGKSRTILDILIRKDTELSIHDSNGPVRPHPPRPLPLQFLVSLTEQI